jgi:hypothetical protein
VSGKKLLPCLNSHPVFGDEEIIAMEGLHLVAGAFTPRLATKTALSFNSLKVNTVLAITVFYALATKQTLPPSASCLMPSV